MLLLALIADVADMRYATMGRRYSMMFAYACRRHVCHGLLLYATHRRQMLPPFCRLRYAMPYEAFAASERH